MATAPSPINQSNLLSQKMNIQFDAPLEAILSIDKVFYHDLKDNVKNLVQSGQMILYLGRLHSHEMVSIRINHFVMNLLDHISLVKIEHETVTCYFLVSS